MGEGGARGPSAYLTLPGGAGLGTAGSPSAAGARRGGRGAGAAGSPQASHKSQLCGQGQGVGRGQGAAAAARRPGREARVRCSCKSSPKCFQAKANQGPVTEHTWPHLPQWAPPFLCKHTHTHTLTETCTLTHIFTLTHTLHSKKQIPGIFYIQSCVAEQVHNTWIDMQS